MKLGSVKTLAVFALVGAVVVPSLVLGTSAADDLFPEGEAGLSIQAADGPNGEYVQTGEDGNVTLDLSGRVNPGVNAKAYTRLDDVFTITNTDSRAFRVWLTDHGSRDDAVTLLDGDAGTPVERNETATVIDPGETMRVGLVVDTNSVETERQLVRRISINTLIEEPDPDTPSTPEPEPTPTATPTPEEPTPTPTENVSASVQFDDSDTATPSDGSAGENDSDGVRITPLTDEQIRQLDAEAGDLGTDAIISSDSDQSPALGDGAMGEADLGGRVSASGESVITRVEEPVQLSGERSTVGTTDSVQAERITEAVDIEVPPGRENSPATVQIRADLDNVGDADLDAVRIGHRTERGWQLLRTSVAERTDEAIVFEARTPGFSPFAVFISPNVEYTWTLPDGTTFSGAEFDHTFAEPGIYNVTLAVTDALNRTDTDNRTIIANDAPTATITVGERNETTGNVTLSATIDDELGDTTATWTFPDGTTHTGTNVTRSFDAGDHTVQLRVEDEYGAVYETETVVSVGTDGIVEQLTTLPPLRTMGGLIVLSLLALIAVGTCYRYGPGTLRMMIRLMDQGPEITAVGEPAANLPADRLGIHELTVVRGQAVLDTVTIELYDDSERVIIRKEHDLGDQDEYSAAPEELLVPPGTELDPQESYVFRVTAVDKRGRHDERYSRRFTLPEQHDVESEVELAAEIGRGALS